MKKMKIERVKLKKDHKVSRYQMKRLLTFQIIQIMLLLIQTILNQ